MVRKAYFVVPALALASTVAGVAEDGQVDRTDLRSLGVVLGILWLAYLTHRKLSQAYTEGHTDASKRHAVAVAEAFDAGRRSRPTLIVAPSCGDSVGRESADSGGAVSALSRARPAAGSQVPDARLDSPAWAPEVRAGNGSPN